MPEQPRRERGGPETMAARESGIEVPAKPVTIRSLTPRQAYLAQLGLDGDPFALPVAEQELAFSAFSAAETAERAARGTPVAFSYAYFFPPPIYTPDQKPLIKALRAFQPAFIYGRPGDGKTTLRLILSAEARRTPDHTLIVTYPLDEDLAGPLTLEEHWQRLAGALAIDLFVQIVEQFNPLDPPPSLEKIHHLREVLRLGGAPVRRLAQRLLDEPETSAPLGFARLWPMVKRPAVRYVARPPALMDLLKRAMLMSAGLVSPPRERAAWLNGLMAARAWGFQRVFVLTDGVDARHRAVPEMLALVRPLLDQLAEWSTRQVAGKFFLPVELEGPVARYLAVHPTQLPVPAFSATMSWDDEALRGLLRRRFEAHGSRQLGFDDLAGPDLEGRLDEALLRSAERNPRRLLLTVSALLNAHLERDPAGHDPFIRLADWKKMRQSWNGEDPRPPALPDA